LRTCATTQSTTITSVPTATLASRPRWAITCQRLFNDPLVLAGVWHPL
jgi:hypothetical protein